MSSSHNPFSKRLLATEKGSVTTVDRCSISLQILFAIISQHIFVSERGLLHFY